MTIIDATSRHMRVRHETEREIQVQIASRKMEQKVMNVIPVVHFVISEGDIHGFPECFIWKCGRGIVYDSMPCSLWWGDCTGRENNDNTYVEGEV